MSPDAAAEGSVHTRQDILLRKSRTTLCPLDTMPNFVAIRTSPLFPKTPRSAPPNAQPIEVSSVVEVTPSSRARSRPARNGIIRPPNREERTGHCRPPIAMRESIMLTEAAVAKLPHSIRPPRKYHRSRYPARPSSSSIEQTPWKSELVSSASAQCQCEQVRCPGRYTPRRSRRKGARPARVGQMSTPKIVATTRMLRTPSARRSAPSIDEAGEHTAEGNPESSELGISVMTNCKSCDRFCCFRKNLIILWRNDPIYLRKLGGEVKIIQRRSYGK